jgi:hypothetical protein
MIGQTEIDSRFHESGIKGEDSLIFRYSTIELAGLRRALGSPKMRDGFLRKLLSEK